jgi:hypothetical protein
VLEDFAPDCGTAFSDGAASARKSEKKNAAASVEGKTGELGPAFARFRLTEWDWCGEVIQL